MKKKLLEMRGFFLLHPDGQRLRRQPRPFFNMTIGVPAATVISSGAACRYGADGKCSDDTLSREISHPNVACTIRGGRFLHSVETLHRVSKSAEVGL